MSKITYNACRNNLGQISDADYGNFKIAVAAALRMQFQDSEICVGDSGFDNESQIEINGADLDRSDIETIANRVFEDGAANLWGGSSSAARVEFEGVTYLLINEATLTNRVFPGWWGDVKDGEEYTSEYSAKAVDAQGNEYIATWIFDQIRGGEIDDDCLNWDVVHSILTA